MTQSFKLTTLFYIILTLTLFMVDEVNDFVLDKLPGVGVTYFSADGVSKQYQAQYMFCRRNSLSGFFKYYIDIKIARSQNKTKGMRM